MRGNRDGRGLCSFRQGSIPAHAGEPPWRCSRLGLLGVYPRACGGTYRPIKPASHVKGLSPRMRGNHRVANAVSADLGSIPAHAGEPSPPAARGGAAGVYPRACGGTYDFSDWPTFDVGLSPRMRGNQDEGRGDLQVQGSIPAHAGEPPSSPSKRKLARVYPRACGGTFPRRAIGREGLGLSPRMRGNPPAVLGHAVRSGSIPAHAGEPVRLARRVNRTWVYPRACGGTGRRNENPASVAGLSPRMRGNLAGQGRGDLRLGSIPAHAGEPRPLRAGG